MIEPFFEDWFWENREGLERIYEDQIISLEAWEIFVEWSYLAFKGIIDWDNRDGK